MNTIAECAGRGTSLGQNIENGLITTEGIQVLPQNGYI